MPTEKEIALIDFLLIETDKGRVKWEPTAQEDQFTTSLRGKYNVTIERCYMEQHGVYYWFKLTDAEDRELLAVSGKEYDHVTVLFDLARRKSLNVDAAIDEILGSASSSKGLSF